MSGLDASAESIQRPSIDLDTRPKVPVARQGVPQYLSEISSHPTVDGCRGSEPILFAPKARLPRMPVTSLQTLENKRVTSTLTVDFQMHFSMSAPPTTDPAEAHNLGTVSRKAHFRGR